MSHPGNTEEKFAQLAEASMNMWASSPTLTAADLAKINIPVLFSVGDDDTVSIAHGAEALEALPMGQLAVIPGSSHFMPVERPNLIAPIIREFLTTDGVAQTMHPVRRQGKVGQ